jgi:hypothetical protein
MATHEDVLSAQLHEISQMFEKSLEDSNAMLFCEAMEATVMIGGQEFDELRAGAIANAQDMGFIRAVWAAMAARWSSDARAGTWCIFDDEYEEVWCVIWDELESAYDGVEPVVAPEGAPR